MNYSLFFSVFLMCYFNCTTVNFQSTIHNGSDLSPENEKTIVGKTLSQLIEKFGQPFQIKNDTVYFFSLQRKISFWKIFGTTKQGIILKIKLNSKQEVRACEFIPFKHYKHSISAQQRMLSLQKDIAKIDNQLAEIRKKHKVKHLQKIKNQKDKNKNKSKKK